jgi:dihydrofolate synthase/folylpolyglutamate synthase
MQPAPLGDYLTALSSLIQPVRASAYPPSLEPMERLLAALDHPERTFESIVVAGSVGKGTACLQIAGALGVTPGPVGLYTGPHLHSFRERLVVDGAPIDYAAFIAGATAVRRAADRLPDIRFSTFELTTALALWWFRERGVRWAVLEIGIGGRYDAVNAVPNQLAVILPIEMEHAAMLGGTLASIAGHKAGIIQAGGVAVSVEQTPVVEAVLREEAAVKQARLRFMPGDALVPAVIEACSEKRGVPGVLAIQNPKRSVPSVPALKVTKPSPPAPLPAVCGDGRGGPEYFRAGMCPQFIVTLWLNQLSCLGVSVGHRHAVSPGLPTLPGRLEWIEQPGRRILIDGAHTARSAQRLRAALETAAGGEPVHLVAGLLRDKSPVAVLAPFDEARFRITLTTAPGHRAIPAADLPALAGLEAAQAETEPDLERALASLLTDPAPVQVVMGSLRMAALAREYLGLLPPEALAEAQATRALLEGEGYLARLPEVL